MTPESVSVIISTVMTQSFLVGAAFGGFAYATVSSLARRVIEYKHDLSNG